MHIFDTDHFSLSDRGASAESQRLRFRLSKLKSHEVATTIITFEEQMRGWLSWLAQARSLPQQVERYRKLSQLLVKYRDVFVLDFDEKAAAEFQRLQKLRLRVGTMDLKIAAIALSHDAVLLTRNLVDFQKVPGLKVEDWAV
jgi:tRNA(fMet)-specific endonuclease VapC